MRIDYTTTTMNYIDPLEFLATDFQQGWLKYFISRDWPHMKSL